MTHRPLRALVYGDVNLNLIDGSAIWVQGIVQVLSRLGCDVSLLLKSPVRTTRLLDPLLGLPGVTVRRPYEERLVDGLTGTGVSAVQATRLLRLIDQQEHFDLIVLRGQRVVRQVVGSGGLRGRLWPYLTDIPQSVPEMDDAALAQLTDVAEASHFLLCQTEELRCFLESSVPAACGKCVLLPPLVPELGAEQSGGEQSRGEQPLGARPVRLVYTGKFAPHWNTYQMTSLPALLRASGISAELHVVGDKIHTDPADPDYRKRMLQALRSAPDVVWHGGHSREEAMRLAGSCDIGLSWRHQQLDASLELSTKVLEFGALGLPVLLNRTPMHEELLGVDYPLFVGDAPGSAGDASGDGAGRGDPSGGDGTRDVLEAVTAAVRSPQMYALAADRCREAARRFTLDQAVQRMRAHLDRAFPSAPALAERSAPLRVGVAGHDLKFFTRLLDYLRALPGVEVRLDQWESLGNHDPVASQELLEWADVIICEWCGPVAVWYSRHKRRGQRLIVRLHRFELYASWPARVDIDAVDQVVCVSPHYARLTRERTGWPAEKIVVVPNWVDVDAYDRPKLMGAQFHLGLIGITPARKRPDLALDVLEELRRRDPRFHLFAKTKMTWDYWWMWNKAEEREHVDEVLARVQCSPLLRGAVVFDPFGPDVAPWLRRIGFVLSTSDDESFHLAPAEGMASGAVPVLRNWPGVETIYDARWIHGDPAEMAEAIHAIVREGRWDDERGLAREQARAAYDLDRVAEMFTDLLVENLSPSLAPT